jgi:hypothetical protein
MVSKYDRAYADWEAHVKRKEDREEGHTYDRELRGGLEHGELSSMRHWMKDGAHSVNQTSRRAGKSTAEEESYKTKTVQMRNGASFTFSVFDEASALSPSEQLDQRPAFDPLAAYAHAELMNRGTRVTGSQKRKIFAAEKARHEQRMKEWKDRMTEQELEALVVEVNRTTLGFGDW